eukprot:1764119-Rhodomonas_salina.1
MRHVECLPIDITNDNNTKALTRAAAIQVGCPVRGTYTKPELRSAILSVLGPKKLKYTAAFYKFGPDPRTISKHCKRALKEMDKHPDCSLKEIVDGMEPSFSCSMPLRVPRSVQQEAARVAARARRAEAFEVVKAAFEGAGIAAAKITVPVLNDALKHMLVKFGKMGKAEKVELLENKLRDGVVAPDIEVSSGEDDEESDMDIE